jgi:hypothetical protein
MAEKKSGFSLSNFTEEVKSRNLARPNRFEVLFTAPASITSRIGGGEDAGRARLVSLFCEISNLPGIAVTTKGQRIYGPAYQRPISLEYGGEAISMTFYVDKNFTVKSFFDRWIFSIVNPNNFNVSYDDTVTGTGFNKYTTDITINQLDEKDNITYSVKLIDAFPKVMNMMDLNMSSTNQVHKLNVTLGYRKWTTTYSESLSSSQGEVLYPIKDTAAKNLGYDDNSNQKAVTYTDLGIQLF